MTVKLFASTKIDELEKEVNAFEAKVKRIKAYITHQHTEAGWMHFATVEFDTVHDTVKSGQSSPLPNSPPQRVKVGVAWRSKKIVGVLNIKMEGVDQYEYVDKKDQQLQDDRSILVENEKGSFLFLENVKQTVTSPDYTIYKVDGGADI